VSDWVIETAIRICAFLLPFSWVALVIAVLVLLPLAAWRKTRGAAGVGLFVVSYILGATTWFLGAAVTFASFGWIGLIIGLFIFGIGVVPLGIIGPFFNLGIQRSRSIFVCDARDNTGGAICRCGLRCSNGKG